MSENVLSLFIDDRRSAPARPLVFLRMWMGLLVAITTFRTWYYGWIEELYFEPTYHFQYPYLDVGGPPSAPWIYIACGTLFISAVCMLINRISRVATITTAILFTYMQLWEATTYLNHYVLVCLLLAFLSFAPVHGKSVHNTRVHSHWLGLFRFQIACVYFFAALAKFQTDWLIHGEPLSMWLRGSGDLSIFGLNIGQLFQLPHAGLVLSWCGFLYDLTIVFFLRNRKTRRCAYIAVVIFHLLTATLFNIGMFPWIMMGSTLIFFDWGRLWDTSGDRSGTFLGEVSEGRPLKALRPYVLTSIVALNLLIPLRHYFYPGNVMWNEDGMRLSWKVMLRDKYGSIKYRVQIDERDTGFMVDPLDELTWRQMNEMSTRPLMIQQYAHHLKKHFQEKDPTKYQNIRITADSFVALNGRPSQRFVKEDFDLTRPIGLWIPTSFLEDFKP